MVATLFGFTGEMTRPQEELKKQIEFTDLLWECYWILSVIWQRILFRLPANISWALTSCTTGSWNWADLDSAATLCHILSPPTICWLGCWSGLLQNFSMDSRGKASVDPGQVQDVPGLLSSVWDQGVCYIFIKSSVSNEADLWQVMRLVGLSGGILWVRSVCLMSAVKPVCLIKSEVPQKVQVVVLQRKLLVRLLLKCKLVATKNDAKFPSGEHETVKPPAGPTICVGHTHPHTHNESNFDGSLLKCVHYLLTR